jgi:hypothetical protein
MEVPMARQPLRTATVIGVGSLLAAGAVTAADPAAADPPNVHCGDTITASLVVNVDLHCTGPGLTIGADGVTLDLGGHTITGSGGDGLGIAVLAPPPFLVDITIRNGTIAEFGQGTFHSACIAAEANGLTLDNLQLQDCYVFVDASTDVSVSDSVLTGSGLGFFFSTRRVSVTGSRIDGGLITFGSDSQPSVLHGNVLTGSHLSFGEANGSQTTGNVFDHSPVSLFAVSVGHTFSGNTFRGAPTALFIDGTSSATVSRNVFVENVIGVQAGNRFGFYPGGTIAENTFLTNGAAGVLVESNGQVSPAGAALDIRDNLFIANGHQSGGLLDGVGQAVNDGLHVNTAPGAAVIVTANHTTGNADYGIEAQPGTVIDGGGNTSQGDPNGCLGVVCA